MTDSQPAAASGFEAPRRRPWPIVAAAVAAVVAALYVVGILLYQSSQGSASVTLANEQGVADRLDASITTSAVDAVKGDLSLRIQVAPEGAYADADGVSLGRPVSILLNSATGRSSYAYKKGERINPIDVVVSLDDAGGSLYPFDRYHGEILLLATTGGAAGATADATTATTEVPVGLRFDGSLAGYKIDGDHLTTTDTSLVDVTVTVSRAPVAVLFAIGILALQVLIAVGALTLATMVLLGRRKAEMAQLTWFSALLFALTPLRNAMPSVPPIGILVDVLVYFWVIGAITVSLLIVLRTILFPPRGAAG